MDRFSAHRLFKRTCALIDVAGDQIPIVSTGMGKTGPQCRALSGVSIMGQHLNIFVPRADFLQIIGGCVCRVSIHMEIFIWSCYLLCVSMSSTDSPEFTPQCIKLTRSVQAKQTFKNKYLYHCVLLMYTLSKGHQQRPVSSTGQFWNQPG